MESTKAARPLPLRPLTPESWDKDSDDYSLHVIKERLAFRRWNNLGHPISIEEV